MTVCITSSNAPPPPTHPFSSSQIWQGYCSLRSPCSLCLCSPAALLKYPNFREIGEGGGGNLSPLFSREHNRCIHPSVMLVLSFVSPSLNRLFVISATEHLKNSTWTTPHPNSLFYSHSQFPRVWPAPINSLLINSLHSHYTPVPKEPTISPPPPHPNPTPTPLP